jgi:hypothetical protein
MTQARTTEEITDRISFTVAVRGSRGGAPLTAQLRFHWNRCAVFLGGAQKHLSRRATSPDGSVKEERDMASIAKSAPKIYAPVTP